MNLKDMLSYRGKCIIHNEKDLFPRCMSPSIMEVNEAGIRLRLDKNVSSPVMIFNFDGTFSSPCTCIIYMQCDECVKRPINKNRGIGLSTLNEMYSNYYFYNFALKAEEGDDFFECRPIAESIKYVIDDKFYHLDFDILANSGYCKMGDCRGDTSLNDMLKGLLSLDLPNLDMSRIQNVDQLVNKLKLYNLFS